VAGAMNPMPFLYLAAVCVVWAVVAAIRIADALQRRNIPVSWFWLRAMLPRYVCQYKEITKKETGRIGPLFYHFVIAINLALACAVIALVAARR